jgi:predicted SAM-dependent methyltransferase
MNLPDASLRNAKLLSGVDLARHEGIEIRPLDCPVVRAEQGRISYADFDTTEGLKVRYSSDPKIRVENMVRIDYVLDMGALPESVGLTRKFHYAVASHVIEHVPDIIGFLNGVTQMLRPGGLICLAIPDKRYTSDYFRNTDVLADVIDAHIRKLRQPSIRQVFDHFASAAEVPVTSAWNGTLHKEHLRRPHSLPEAMKMARAAAVDDQRLDCRCHVFTPESFFEVLRGCFELGLLRVDVVRFWATAPSEQEFFVTLRKMDAEMDTGARMRIQIDSIPPPEIVAKGQAVGWEPQRSTAFPVDTHSCGF